MIVGIVAFAVGLAITLYILGRGRLAARRREMESRRRTREALIAQYTEIRGELIAKITDVERRMRECQPGEYQRLKDERVALYQRLMSASATQCSIALGP